MCLGRVGVFLQDLGALKEHLLRQTESRQQAPTRQGAYARCQAKAQPGAEFLTVHG
jgi:hypothetical protein